METQYFKNDYELFEYAIKKQIPQNRNINKCKYEYDEEINIETGKFPEFINDIINDEYLDKIAKEEFIEEFIPNYINDYCYRIEVHNKYILFLNNHYWGVFSNILDLCNIGTDTDTKLFYDINKKSYESMFFTQEIYSEKYKDEDCPLGINFIHIPFNVNILISNVKHITKNDLSILNTGAILDTGCSNTFLKLEYWNHTKLIFEDVPQERNLIYQKLYTDKKMLLLNLMKTGCKRIKIRNSEKVIMKNKIYFKEPIYIKILNLEAVPLYSIVVPLKYDEYQPVLLGLDFISKVLVDIEENKMILQN